MTTLLDIPTLMLFTKHGAGLSALGRRLRLVVDLYRERIDYATSRTRGMVPSISQ